MPTICAARSIAFWHSRTSITGFPPWKTIYHVFRAWSLDGTWAALNDALRVCLRRSEDRHDQPSAAILDSQSVKSDGHDGKVGFDAGKKTKGRKRHILVDTLGLVLGVVVTLASCLERDGAQQVLERVGGLASKAAKALGGRWLQR